MANPIKDVPPVRVEYTPEFKRNVRALAKTYCAIQADLQPVIESLEAGQVLGDHVPGTRFRIFKVRVQNSDIRKGKRSGYRMIYHAKTPTHVILVTVYSKLDQSDVSADQIRRVLNEFDEKSK